MGQNKYIASLDVGTTTIRCFIYDSHMQLQGTASEQVVLLFPQPGFFEIDPNTLWNSILKTIRNATEASKLSIDDIDCLAISTQRASFITWDRETEEYFHNFITWKDIRAHELVDKWNASLTLKTINNVSYCLYLLSRHKRFLAGSVLKLMNNQVTLRLLWQMQNNPKLQEGIRKKTAFCSTLDAWLLYKLRKGSSKNKNVEHISDITSATATGMYDPFTLSWASWAFSIFSIKGDMLPRVVENSYDFGFVDETVFGRPIKIACSMGDQSAAMWGSCCFNEGDLKVTLGTGTFLNLNSSSKCLASLHGLYPIVAWQLRNNDQENELVYAMEGSSNDTGTIIKWAVNFGLFNDPSESSGIANSVDDSHGVYFIPAFSGLGAPINDFQAASGFLGVLPSTRKAHLVRALLESIVFRIVQLYNCTLKETKYKIHLIKVDGGVSKNDFICQLLADITGIPVERSTNSEASALGAAFVAGINLGIWKEKEELCRLRKIEKVFHSRKTVGEKYILKMKTWENAIERFKGWYDAAEFISNMKHKH